MYKLRLIKGRSYTGNGIKVTAEKPFVEIADKEIADALAASGYFSVISNELQTKLSEEKPIEKMSEKELESYAAENGIDLTGLRKR